MGERLAKVVAAHPDVEVWAGGGVVWRRVDDVVEVLLVHRDHYDDWTFPKGKLDKGEGLRECALREVAEETGLVCRTGGRLDVIRYVDGRGRKKGVVYWLMTVDDGHFVPNDEVDACGWFDAASARIVLSHGRDEALMDEAEQAIESSTIAP